MSAQKQVHGQLSVLLIAEDVLDRDPIALMIPTQYRLSVVHAEVEAAALAYNEAQPDVLLLAVNDLDASASFRVDLLRRANVAEDAAPISVALCLNRHSARAGRMCLQGAFDDFATAKPTPHTERIHLTLHRADLQRQIRRELTRSRERLDLARGQFESLASLQRELSIDVAKLRADSSAHLELETSLADMTDRLARLATAGRNACLGRTKSILVVDDDELMREVLGAALEGGGYEVRHAASAEQAVETLVAHQVSLVLMDLMMPGLDGIAATREIRALPNYRSVPIIVVSGHGNRDSVQSSRLVGANDFVVKPVDQERLLEKVRRYLD